MSIKGTRQMTLVEATAAAVIAGGPLLVAAIVGFLVAGAMWVTGILVLMWSERRIGVAETMVEWMGVRVKELGQDWSHYLWNKSDDDSPQIHSS